MTRNTSGTGVLDAPAWSNSLGHQRLRQFFVVHPRGSRPGRSSPRRRSTSRRSPARRSSSRSGSTTTASARAAGDFRREVRRRFRSTTGRASRRMIQVEIGTEKVDALEARANRVVSTTWTATGPVDRDASQHWRIFVILDPDDQVKDETHELERPLQPASRRSTRSGSSIRSPARTRSLESGQNNQGYGLLTVHASADIVGAEWRARARTGGGGLAAPCGPAWARHPPAPGGDRGRDGRTRGCAAGAPVRGSTGR